MKETYFLPDTIRVKARAMIEQTEYVRRRKSPRLMAAASALLVLDMQSYFLSDVSHAFVPSARAIVPGIVSLIKAYTANGFPVFLTRHVNDRHNAGMMAQWWSEVITEDNPLSSLEPEIADSHDCRAQVIDKSSYDAFHHTRLEGALKEQGVERVVICGVMTHLCCETTARSAFIRGFEVLFVVDGTATYNEQFHRATLLNIAHGFAQLTTVEDLLSLMPENDHG